MSVNKYFMPGLVILLLLATIGIAQTTGFWIVSGKQMIDVSQLASSSEIRGWMTVEEIATGLGLPLDQVYSATGIPKNVPPDTALKDLEQIIPDFEVSGIQDALAAYLGETEAATPETRASADSTAQLEGGAVLAPSSDRDLATEVMTPVADAPQDHETEAATILASADIKGSYTLEEIAAQTHIALDRLLAQLALPPDTNPQQTVRDLVQAGQIVEVETVRDAVTALQGK